MFPPRPGINCVRSIGAGLLQVILVGTVLGAGSFGGAVFAAGVQPTSWVADKLEVVFSLRLASLQLLGQPF